MNYYNIFTSITQSSKNIMSNHFFFQNENTLHKDVEPIGFKWKNILIQGENVQRKHSGHKPQSIALPGKV